ncbi:MAG: error-prone DNA polymerase [Deltaproteobacteria bacterium]|nr:error-prone DNA polymerase [Deltaproteobacteria bacterium]
MASPRAHSSDLAQDYVELRTRSAFSFLEGCSDPEDLVEAAAEKGHQTLALADRDGVSGAPRFHKAARLAGLRALVGSTVSVGQGRPDNPFAEPDRVTLLCESPEGWRRLCRTLTHAHGRRNKALEARDTRARNLVRVGWDELEAEAGHWSVLLRGDERLTPALLDRAKRAFGERLAVDVSHSLDRRTERLGRYAADLAEARRVRVVASGDVRCAWPRDRRLLDALICLRERRTLDTAGRHLPPNGEGHVHTREEIARRFRDHPAWIQGTRTIAERCEFTLEDLDYRFPAYPLDPGETQMSRLRELTRIGARNRYGARPGSRVLKQLAHELEIIEKLDLAGYFLIVEDISSFARAHRILCQGRGSAANSAVCYALGITAVDPVGMDLLFERFLSEERGEWPDIDIDLPSGDQREKVIQYVFGKYGLAGAAMTANVITYRIKMAVREMGKVLGQDPEAIGRLSKLVARMDFPAMPRGSAGERRANEAVATARGEDPQAEVQQEFLARLREAKLAPDSPDVKHWVDLVRAVQGLPRHLGQHSGGIVIAAGRLDEVVPIEPATMADRRIVQWDKDDCADMGIIKIDLLGLGMLAALEETIPLIQKHEDVEIDLAHLPPDDPKTYAMMRKADTVGVFQIESRAQMATLPRLKPKTFYDLVVEIAIIRPGPIVGQMVHPYLDRRAGREPIEYPHPSLEPILKRTLGVPLFQEQLLRIAMVAAGFSGGEAEELRRAMGFKRSTERMAKIEKRLREGMRRQGFSREAEDQIVLHISSFALYGFPESHSASFALIAYASSYLKCHPPAAFLVGLLRAQPMGFYSAATLVKDAQRHGVEIRPVDVLFSNARADLEEGSPTRNRHRGAPAVRIGLDAVGGLKTTTAERIVAARQARGFEDLGDFVRQVGPDRPELEALAELGALARLRGSARDRRDALWQVAALERDPNSLFAGREIARSTGWQNDAPLDPKQGPTSPLEPMDAFDETLADYRLAGLTTDVHLMGHLRESLTRRGVLSAARLRETPDGAWVRIAGHAIVRQRPGSAKGFCFVTLEDETGLSNAVLTPDISARFRIPLHQASLLEIAGPLQRVEGVIHVRAREIAPVDLSGARVPDTGPAASPKRDTRKPKMPRSHDYR